MCIHLLHAVIDQLRNVYQILFGAVNHFLKNWMKSKHLMTSEIKFCWCEQPLLHYKQNKQNIILWIQYIVYVHYVIINVVIISY